METHQLQVGQPPPLFGWPRATYRKRPLAAASAVTRNPCGSTTAPKVPALTGSELPLSPTALKDTAHEFISEHPTLPRPGSGRTLQRWKALAAISATDLCLGKILEAHYDAQAILAELRADPPGSGELWAVWAAESPDTVVEATRHAGFCTVSGIKPWCSGADMATNALMTARSGRERVLVKIELSAAGISPPERAWDAVGMSRVVSGALKFDATPATVIGAPGSYLSRPGFWHGGAGIAACWLGAAIAIAETLRVAPRAAEDSRATANLGIIDFKLAAALALLRETAASIDAEPFAPHRCAALRARSFVERLAVEITDRVGRSLGPGPLCRNRAHAQRCADLTTFIRQSHADKDWHELGLQASGEESSWWL